MTKYKIELKWAVIFFLMYLAWIALEKISGLHANLIEYQQIASVMVLVPSFLVYLLAIRDKKKRYFNNVISFRQAFLSGMILTAFIVLLSPLSQFISMRLLSPDFFTNMQKYAVASHGISEEKAISQLNLGKFIITSIFGGLVTGLIFSLIIAAFVKKKE